MTFLSSRSRKSCLLAAVMATGLSLGLASSQTFAQDNNNQAASAQAKQDIPVMKNEDFYKDGKFQADKAKEAYFAMMKRFGYPIPQSLKEGLWAIDFNLGDFAHTGMAGIFWYNDKDTSVFAHEIYLLPGQMIAEHAHVATENGKAKREAWHVRHGSIYTFGEGTPKEACPVQLPASQEKFITVRSWKLVKEGQVDDLKRATAKHFMIAGPEGAIVSEYGTYHDGAGLRFTNPGVKF